LFTAELAESAEKNKQSCWLAPEISKALYFLSSAVSACSAVNNMHKAFSGWSG